MIIITVSHPESGPTTHRFDESRVTIGREPDNDLVLASPSCSRYHAEILQESGEYRIVDRGSTNGIKVGGQRVSEQALTTGLTVDLGAHSLTFMIPQHETPATVMISREEVTEAVTKATQSEPPIQPSTEPPPAPPVQVPPPTAPPPASPRSAVVPPAPPATSGTPAVLYVHVTTRGRAQSFKVVAGAEYLIGRSAGADIVVDDPGCSVRHAVIEHHHGRFVIRDLDSGNGIRLNDERVREAAIVPGDRLAIGQTEIEVSDRPPDSSDEDVLLARTMHRLPVQRPALDSVEDLVRDAAERRIGRRVATAAMAGVAAVALLVIALLAWRISRTAPSPRPVEAGETAVADGAVTVRVVPIERKEMVFSVTAAGTVSPREQVTVSAEVPARVVEVVAEEGDAVARGDILVRLDDTQIQLQIDEARSAVSQEQVQLAREDFERKERLFQDGAVTRSVRDQAHNAYLSLEAAWKSAQAKIAQLRERAAKSRIRAPISGVVARILASAGEFAGPGAPLVVIEDTEEVLVRLEVSDRDVVKLRPMQVVEATSDAFPGRIFQGVVERVASSADPRTKGFAVEARLGNPDGSLRGGMIATVKILLEKRSALVVPADALIDDRGDEAQVMVVSGGVARSVTVDLGNRRDRDVEALRGVSEGDRIVVYGQEEIHDGQAVKTY